MTTSGLYDEKELLQQVASGSEEAFSLLFRRYRGKLYHYVLDFTQSKEEAEDIVHDVFLKIWNSRETLTAIDSINSYLYKMSRNQAINGLRRKAKERLVLAELRQEPMAIFPDIDPASQKEVRDSIQQAISKLSPQQRKVFLLSRQDGLKHEQIAEELGISITTVKTHIGRALQFLREEIRQAYGEQAIAIFVLYGLS